MCSINFLVWSILFFVCQIHFFVCRIHFLVCSVPFFCVQKYFLLCTKTPKNITFFEFFTKIFLCVQTSFTILVIHNATFERCRTLLNVAERSEQSGTMSNVPECSKKFQKVPECSKIIFLNILYLLYNQELHRFRI